MRPQVRAELRGTDAGSEGVDAGEAVAGRGSEQVARELVGPGPVADFLGGVVLGGEQRLERRVGTAASVQGQGRGGCCGYAAISPSLGAALTASRIAAAGHPDAGLLARLGKAAGVDTAVTAVADLAPLIGASGFQRHRRVAKVRADLTGLLYADGIHDSLYRSGGVTLLAAAGLQTPVSTLAVAA